MKASLRLLATCAALGLAPTMASAADLGGYYDDRERYESYYEYQPYEQRGPVVERAPVVRERYVERRIVEPEVVYEDDDEPEVIYYTRRHPRPYSYDYGYYDDYAPYRFGPAVRHRRHVWRAHDRW